VSEFLLRNAWLVPFFPLLGGLIAAVAGRRLGGNAHLPVVVGIGLAFLVSLGLLTVAGPETTTVVARWIDVSNLRVPLEFRVDGLTTMMLSMVTFVATLVAVYAAGYMAGDPGYPRFFAVVGLFVFSMTGLLLSNNYLLTYAFWEGVGVCSYLLVGYYHAKPSAAAAAKKAFLVNRVGDVGFAIAIFWMWSLAPGHDLSYGNILSESTIHHMGTAAVQGIVLLMLWAATAKSAQIPLYVWLPDAMEGPTPVSALIHAATMVTAGVYLIARSMPMVVAAPLAPPLIATIGGLTALFAALIALTQTDLKRVLAYSTVSQLGYMFMALGTGVRGMGQVAVVAAMFHLFTHAFFKALLFLAAGSVMHSMGGVIDMRRFGGLRHRLPWTFWTFAVGGWALAGLPPFSGFFSKDEILAGLNQASHLSDHDGGSTSRGAIYATIYWIGLITAGLTAFYTGRAFFLTFFGPEKLPSPDDPEAEADAGAHAHAGHGPDEEPVHGHDQGHGGHHPIGHESPPLMVYPLVVLAVCAALAGLVFGPTHIFEHHLEQTLGFESLEQVTHEAGWMTPLLGTIAAALGLGLSYLMYARPSPLPGVIAARIAPLYRASYLKFGVDTLYDWIVVRPTLALAATAEFLDHYLVDGLVRGVSWAPRLFGRDVLGPFQNGLIQFYAAATALSVAVLLMIFLLI